MDFLRKIFSKLHYAGWTSVEWLPDGELKDENGNCRQYLVVDVKRRQKIAYWDGCDFFYFEDGIYRRVPNTVFWRELPNIPKFRGNTKIWR